MSVQGLTYSFDIFDTLLTRVVVHPADVFRLVQRELQGKGGIPEVLRKSFVSARVWAEFKSRRLSVNEDVALDSIYHVIERDYRLESESVQWVMEKELEIEARCLVPIESQSRRVKELHHEGRRLLFISDMYLPSSFIQTQLQRYGLFLTGDRLYVSGELSITKGSGKLFDYVLQKEGLAPDQLLHCGDNPHSDAFVPARKGIRLDPSVESAVGSNAGALSAFVAKGRYGVSLLRARFELGRGYVA